VGFVRPKVLLYGENCTEEAAITAAFNDNLREPVDAVLIVGTRLQIPSVWDFAKRLSKMVRARDPDNMVAWVNEEPPKLGPLFESLITHRYVGDCDAFANYCTL
jgi:NAD-dependent SIR2 family protein deacetylase